MLTTEFLSALRRQGSIPSSFADTELLAWGDVEVRAKFVPLLERLRQNFFIRELNASPDVRGKVQIPARAIGATLRSVQLYTGANWVSLPLRNMEEVDVALSGQPNGYYVDAGSIVLLPRGASGTLRIRYAARPGAMVKADDLSKAAAITAVTPGATTTAITLNGVYTGSATVDVLSAGPAHQQKAISTTYGGGTVLTADLQEALAVGDYIAAADTSPFVPLPEELTGALIHRVAGTVLRSLGYDEEASQQLSLAEAAIEDAKQFLMPRNEGNPQQVRGGLRASLGRRWRWW